MPTIFHVTAHWDGGDLICLQFQGNWTDEMARRISCRWPDWDPWDYFITEGRFVHCHDTLEMAEFYREHYCPDGEIVAIEADALDIEPNSGRHQPAVEGRIPASAIRRLP